MGDGKKPTQSESSLEETAGNIALLVLFIGACLGLYKAWGWWSERRPSGGECWYVFHKDAELMCVVARDMGKEISPSALAQITEKQPPLMCGTPSQAADFVQKAGHKICEHTVVREGAKFDPP